MTGKKKLKRGIKKKYKFCVNILTEEIWNGIFTGLIFTKYLQPQMFLFHWIRKETNTNNLFFLIKFMVFLRTTFYKTSVNNSEKNPCSVLIFFVVVVLLQSSQHSTSHRRMPWELCLKTLDLLQLVYEFYWNWVYQYANTSY